MEKCKYSWVDTVFIMFLISLSIIFGAFTVQIAIDTQEAIDEIHRITEEHMERTEDFQKEWEHFFGEDRG